VSSEHTIERVRHETRLRRLTVATIADITPRMRRFRLTGVMTGFASPGYADHIKAFFFADGTPAQLPEIGPSGVDFGPGRRPEMRDYTPRAFDVAQGTLDLDFVLHGDGPASSWAASARVGDTLIIGGPRGSQIVPHSFEWYLLAGDETALPAIGRRIEELPVGKTVIAVIEVVDKAEEQAFPERDGLTVVYVHRSGAEAGTTTLVRDAIERMPLPAGDGYAFVAGEADMSRSVRDHLIARGLNPSWIKAAGYWKRGVADAHEPH
jgi:NADPH-dependent ferric siderophore reductase